jgi:predicted acetyltransferase
MSTIRPLTADDLPAAVRIIANAYPAMRINTEEERQRQVERFEKRLDTPGDTYYGLFRDDALVGAMRLIDYQMNVRGAQVGTGGVGMVAVDLLHKKEKVARDMIRFYLERCRSEGMPLAALYPFRPDFYRQMGFGYGTKSSQYAISPASLPDRGDKSRVRMLSADDKTAMRDCYLRVQERTHGLMAKSETDMERMLSAPDARIVGVASDGALTGYLSFGFDNDPGGNFVKNNIHVRELVYDTREALADLLSFLHSQADQIDRIVLETQDEHFHHLLFDPRDTSGRLFPSVYHQVAVVGVGIMYRIVDTRAALQALAGARFGDVRCRVALTVRDSFLPENSGTFLVSFEDGHARLMDRGDHDVALTLDVAELSSLLMGTIDAEHLYLYGRAEVSDPKQLDTLNRLFAVPTKPICMTHF